MNTIKFKTNINCAGCLAKVSPFLNAEQNFDKWEVDTSIPEKILTVETDETNADRVISVVKSAGFNIERV
jgi:copper chaperone